MTEEHLLPLYATATRAVNLGASAGISLICLLLALRAWRHSGSRAIAAVSVWFFGWTLHSFYFCYWYAARPHVWALDAIIVPNVATLIMNAGAIAWLIALAILGIVALVMLAAVWLRETQRMDRSLERQTVERRGWEARDRDAWLYVDQLTREIAEIRGVLNVRRAKRTG